MSETPSLRLFSPSGCVRQALSLRRAERFLSSRGFEVTLDESAGLRLQRFAGTDDDRLAALHRTADAAPAVAMATRGGYGLSRLLDQIDWARVGRSIASGTRWVGYSDFTAFHLAAIAHGAWTVPKARDSVSPVRPALWAGPMACGDFGLPLAEVDDVTEACFLEAMSGELEGVGFKTPPGFDGLEAQGTLWGGNLALLTALVGTPHLPKIRGGILFLEDVGEAHYRAERMLMQLLQAGILGAQKAVLLGGFTDVPASPLDKGYGFKAMVDALRARTDVPILTGLPFGHIHTKVSLPLGVPVELAVQGRDVWLAWGA